ncbi:MAG: peptide-methionine (S)-S-oxide reductase MsrA [Thermoplasmataceae archaeon]
MEKEKIETVILGGGCFWCTEAIYLNIKGVINVESGYSGGTTINPSYEDVCSGKTGHAEVIRVTFDTEKISFNEIMEIFFSTHDPTSLNRQGEDVGEQYRSTIFCTNEEQLNLAKRYIKKLNEDGIFNDPIVTSVNRFINFYPSESYHKNYYNTNKSAPYCRAVIAPKLQKFMKNNPNLLQEKR